MHLNLTGIIEVALDFFHNIACNNGHLVIRDDIRLEHDTDFTARLNRKTLIHAVKRVGDLLKLLKALDVIFEVFTPCAGPCAFR